MIFTIIIYIGVSMFFLWFLIEHLGGVRPGDWLELFIVTAFMSLAGAAGNIVMIFSLKPGVIFTGIIISILISNAGLYLYLDFRYGIENKRKIIYIMLAFFVGRFILSRILGLPIY